MKNEMGKTYEPRSFEEKIYQMWEEKESFKADSGSQKEKFSVVLPPPNITGQLHMGHALDGSLQDVMVRFKRLQGFDVLWLPGTDHASIATEVKVWDALAEEGFKKEEVSREAFLERAWQWKDMYESRIISQMKKLGNSCDWSKLRFTMDEGCNKAVTRYFVDMYRDGLIYKGERMINWCVDCETSISDLEVEHEEKDGKLYYLKYLLEGSEDYIEVATTRPETIFGDTAVAVNPENPKYKHLIGKKVCVPICGRIVDVIGDDYVDIEFGTGALKVTPSHDVNDFEIGERHGLESLRVLELDGSMNHHAGKYEGLSREDCRKQLVKDLEDAGLLLKKEPYKHSVGTCYRCHKNIEPMVSLQWFAKTDEVAKRGIEELNKTLFFVPQRFEKTYINWLENIKDWCISRQLWWGHRIPAYYCEDCENMMVLEEAPAKCSSCASERIRQDDDVLDTWFSSALWPFSTLGWPEKSEDMDAYFPTSTLVTGYDIIFFWVARMVFASLYNLDVMPFKDVLIHGLVRDDKGRKMSKSLGNGVDPLEIIDQYGADALRFMLISGNTPGNDQRFQIERVEAARNFANKLWNASRFVMMGVDSFDDKIEEIKQLDLADKWILTRLAELSEEMFKLADAYEYSMAASQLYEFIWNEYCDWYIELAKIRLYGPDEEAKKDVQRVLIFVLKKILLLLQPYMPFITQEIYSYLSDSVLMNETWVDLDRRFVFPDAKEEMDLVMEAIKAIRNARQEMDIKPSKKAKLYVDSLDNEIYRRNETYFKQLASVSELESLETGELLSEDSLNAITRHAKLYIPADELIDYQKEFDRLSKDEKKFRGEIDRIEGKLSNQGFVAKAPAEVIGKEKEKLGEYQKMLEDTLVSLDKVRAKL